MAKKVVKVTMRTCTVQMRIKCLSCVRHVGHLLFFRTSKRFVSAVGVYTARKYSAFTLAESVVVIVLVSLFVAMAVVSFGSALRRNTFKGQAQGLVSAMQMAASAAAESDRRYEVIIDPTEQSYLLRQITTPELSEVLEEEIIIINDFGESCRVSYIEFDDGEYISDGWAKFRVGRSGWQYGGKIVLLDRDLQPYSVVVNRISRAISLQVGDVELLRPKAEYEVPF